MSCVILFISGCIIDLLRDQKVLDLAEQRKQSDEEMWKRFCGFWKIEAQLVGKLRKELDK